MYEAWHTGRCPLQAREQKTLACTLCWMLLSSFLMVFSMHSVCWQLQHTGCKNAVILYCHAFWGPETCLKVHWKTTFGWRMGCTVWYLQANMSNSRPQAKVCRYMRAPKWAPRSLGKGSPPRPQPPPSLGSARILGTQPSYPCQCSAQQACGYSTASLLRISKWQHHLGIFLHLCVMRHIFLGSFFNRYWRVTITLIYEGEADMKK